MTQQQTISPSPIGYQRIFPLWLGLSVTAFACVLIPVYGRHYGPSNFLWFSDIGLFGAAVALWTASRLLASMMLLAAGLADAVWSIDFVIALITGWHPVGMTAYMYDAELPVYLRVISLFHLFLPPLLVWIVWKLGYDRRALAAQTVFGWLVLWVTFLITDPARNINWAFGYGFKQQDLMPPWMYLLLMCMLIPLVMYGPVHVAAMRLLRRNSAPTS